MASPKPNPIALPVSTTQAAAPTPSPIPPRSDRSPTTSAIDSSSECKPDRALKLLLEIRDLSSAGAQDFLSAIASGSVVGEYVRVVLRLLYVPGSSVPPTRSVTLVVRPNDILAYTTGKEIDDDHKEIHFSTDYIGRVSHERRRVEIIGVLTHELVHCFQWNAEGTAPGGLIEGIADWVRLNAGLAPPHWNRKADGEWDAGYQHTAYFLDYLEERFGYGTVRKINQRLKEGKYVEHTFWSKMFHCGVKKLWDDYKKWLGEEEKKGSHDTSVEVTDQKVMGDEGEAPKQEDEGEEDDADGSMESSKSEVGTSTDLKPTPTSLGGSDDEK
ncbi:MAG: hypothetical protein M1816_007253 [Peltula sp. TS41687]|nr:MAG: hypothetical protein M1816_007253 [Peltula sp. TS41687]